MLLKFSIVCVLLYRPNANSAIVRDFFLLYASVDRFLDGKRLNFGPASTWGLVNTY